MKRLFILIALFVFGFSAGAQVLQRLTTPYEYRLAAFDTLLIRADTVPLPGTLKLTWSAIAPKGDDLYLWSVGQQKWIPVGSGGTVGVTSVNASISGALAVSGGPVTSSGTLTFTWTGSALSYVKGNGSLGIFVNDVYGAGDSRYAPIAHGHVASDISDFTVAGRNLLSAGTGISYNSSTGVISWSGSGSGIASLNGLTGTTQTFGTPVVSGLSQSWNSTGTAHTLTTKLGGALTQDATFSGAFNVKYGTNASRLTTFDAYTTGNININSGFITAVQATSLVFVSSAELQLEGTTSIKMTGAIPQQYDTTTAKPLTILSDGTVGKGFWFGGGGAGEVNTASNLGGGLANYSTKVGADLRFNSFDAADFDLASNLISIDATKWLTIAAGNAAFQPLDGDLTSIAGLAGTAGFLKKTAVNTWVLDNSTYLTSEVDGSTTNELQTLANTSDATSHTVTLSNSGGSVQLIEGANITLTTGGTGSAGTVTIAATGFVTSESDPLALKIANNLSDLANAGTARTNLGGTTVGQNFFTATNPGAISFPKVSATNTVTFESAATFLGSIGAQPQLNGTGFVKASGTTISYDNSTYLTGNQTVTLTGNVTGSGATSIATTIGANVVANSMLAQVATGTFHGRVTAGTGNVETLTGTQATTLLDVFTSTLKGLAPASGGGTTNYLRADGTWAAPGGTGANALGTYIVQTATNAPANAQVLGSLSTGILKVTTTTGVLTTAVAGDFPTLNQNTTGTAASVSGTNVITNANLRQSAAKSVIGNSTNATANVADISASAADQVLVNNAGNTAIGWGTVATGGITNNAVTVAKMQQINTASFLGRVTAATGNVENLTGTQATTILDVFTTSLKGLAPASGGGTTNFLRADGAWAAPSGVSQPNTQVVFGTGAGVSSDADFTFNTTTNALTLAAGGYIGQSYEVNSLIGTMATPAVGHGVFYFKTDKLPYAMNSDGTEMALYNTGTSGANALGTYIVQTSTNAPANAQILGSLSTGILKVTTTTGVLTTAVAGDFPTLNQNTTGTAASVSGTNVITNANLRQSAAKSVIGNSTNATANVADISASAADQVLVNNGGNTAIAWGTVATGGLTNNAVTYAKFQQISTASFLGRVTAATGNVENLTGTQATTLLDVFTSTLKGLAPASGGGTTNFLRADGTWAAPGGGSGANALGTYIVQTSTNAPANAQILASLGTGLVKNTTSTGVLSIATASDIPDLSATYIKNQTSQQTSANFNIDGNGDLGGKLTIAGTNTGFALQVYQPTNQYVAYFKSTAASMATYLSVDGKFDGGVYREAAVLLLGGGSGKWRFGTTQDATAPSFHIYNEQTSTESVLVDGTTNITTVQGLSVVGASAFGSYKDQTEITAPSTPSSGKGRWYVSSADSKPHFITDGGTDYDLTATSGGTDQTFANTDLTATANRTHDWGGFWYKQNNLLELELASSTSNAGARWSKLRDYKPFYSGLELYTQYNTSNYAGVGVYNANDASGVTLYVSRPAGYSDIAMLPTSISLNPYLGVLKVDTLNTSSGSNQRMLTWDISNGNVGYQTIPSGGSGLGDPGGNGIVVRTALNTTVNRTLTGTTNKITITNGDGQSGNPTFTVGSDIVQITQANTYTAGMKQTFASSATTAGVSFSGVSSDPSSLADYDVWFNSTAFVMKYRANGTTRTVVNLDEAQTLTNKTINGSSNTITNLAGSVITSGTVASARLTSIKQAKGLSIQSPTASENATIFYTTQAITVEEVRTVMLGTSQSVTLTINYGSSRASATGTIVASNTFDSGDTGYQTTGFAHTLNTTSIPAGSYIWLTTSATSGTINELNITLTYSQQ